MKHLRKAFSALLSITSLLILLLAFTSCFSHQPSQGLENSPSISEKNRLGTPTHVPSEQTIPTISPIDPTKTEFPIQAVAYPADIPYLRGINLGNALEAPVPGEWGVTIEEAHIKAIADAGFNAIRLPVRFSGHTGPATDYIIKEEFFSLVDTIIQWGLDEDLYLILDFHHFEEIMENPNAEKEHFYAIWGQIADRYQDLPPTVFFELLNEPHFNLDADTWNEIISNTIRIIRRTNSNRILLIGGIDYSNIDSLYQLALPPEDDQIFATFHYYEPFTFTHQGAGWVEGSSQWVGETWDNSQNELAEIENALDRAVYWSNLYETPLIMGEFGAIKQADPSSRVKWTRAVVQAAGERNIGWFYWELCSTFGVYDCQEDAWDTNALDGLMSP